MSVIANSYGQIAYEAFCKNQSGTAFTPWWSQSESVQVAWCAGAVAVLEAAQAASDARKANEAQESTP